MLVGCFQVVGVVGRWVWLTDKSGGAFEEVHDREPHYADDADEEAEEEHEDEADFLLSGEAQLGDGW